MRTRTSPDGYSEPSILTNPSVSQAHLETCDECQREVAELSPSATLLEAAAPGVDLATGPELPADLQARTIGRCGPGGTGTAPWPAGRCYPAACLITEATACGWDT